MARSVTAMRNGSKVTGRSVGGTDAYRKRISAALSDRRAA
jgi:hypothetical protein